MRTSMIVYHTMLDDIDTLSDTEAGRLFRWMLKYSRGENPETPTGQERYFVRMCMRMIDEQIESYNAKVERARAVASAGGRAKAAAHAKALANSSQTVDADSLEFLPTAAESAENLPTDTISAENVPNDAEKGAYVYVNGYGYVYGNVDNCTNESSEIRGGAVPKGARAPAREARTFDRKTPEYDTIESYADTCLDSMTPDNLRELYSFVCDLGEDLVRHAINEACAQGVPRYGYVKKILNRYIKDGIKTVAAAQESSALREAQTAAAPPGRKLAYKATAEENPLANVPFTV